MMKKKLELPQKLLIIILKNGDIKTLNNSISIMQPTYLPWIGFFQLINSVDRFIFLDNVKLEKSSWQTRNKILVNKNPSFITVPVLGSRKQLISEALINSETKWRKKHILTLEQTYSKYPFGEWMLNIIIPIINDLTINHLCELNMKLIKTICSELGIKCNFFLSSKIPTKSTKSMRLIEICNYFGCINYYSPLGSKGYIETEKYFKKSGINVYYQKFKLEIYNQHTLKKFISHLSIVDIIANLGPEQTLNYIKQLKNNE